MSSVLTIPLLCPTAIQLSEQAKQRRVPEGKKIGECACAHVREIERKEGEGEREEGR